MGMSTLDISLVMPREVAPNQPTNQSHDTHPLGSTVDGLDPTPVEGEVVDLLLFTGLYTSKVVQDFSHQQYHPRLLGLSRNYSIMWFLI